MSPKSAVNASPEGVVLRLHVQPKAKHPHVGGLHDGRLRVSVSEPPDRGRANAAVITLIAATLKIPRTEIRLLRGETSRQKDLLLCGQSLAEVAAALGPHLDETSPGQAT